MRFILAVGPGGSPTPGKDPRVEEGINRMLDYDERFLAAVEEGRASARRSDLFRT